MYRSYRQDKEEAEKLSGKQQRPTAEGQDRSSMLSHDQAQSNLTPVRLSAKDPSTSHEFQVAHDEGGGVRQKDLPSSPLAHAGTRTHLEESIPSAQGNTREYESSNYAADSTPSSTLKSPNPSDVAPTESSTTVSQPGVMVAPAPIHPTLTEIQSDQNTPSDSPNLSSSYSQKPSLKALDSTSLDTVPPLTSKLATPQSYRSSSKKKKTWYGMEVRDDSDPSGLGPRKASPFSLGFGYKEHKKAALAAASAAAVSDAASHTIVGSPVLSSPLTTSSSSANPESVQFVRPTAASAIAALRSHSFSPSQDRPVHIQENMHAPSHHRASASEMVPNAPKFEATSSTAVPSASTHDSAPLVLSSTSSSTQHPAHSQPSDTVSTAAMTTPTKGDTLKTSTKPKASKAHYLSKSGSIKERFASSPKFSKLLKNIPGSMGRSYLPTGPVVLKAPPSAPAKIPGAFPDSPVVAPVAATGAVTPSVVPVYSTPTESNESLSILVGPVQSTAGAVAVQDPNAVIPAYSTPIVSQSVLPITVAPAHNVSAASIPVSKESTSTSKSAIATAAAAVAIPAAKTATLPMKLSTAAALKTPKKNLSLYDEEESTYPRGDEGAKLENPAHPAVVEDVIEIKKLPKELHSTAAGLKKPKKNLSLYDEEEGAYPRGDEVDMHENPAHPPSVENIVKVKRLPKVAVAALAAPAVMAMSLPEKHSTAAGLKTPKKDLSLYDEEQSTYPRGDEGAKLENPAHPAVVEDVIEIKKLPKEFHSTSAGLKKPKKNLSLYDEEEGAYPRGDEVDMHENPAHPPSVENIVKVKRLPKVAVAALAVPAVMAMSLPEKHSTAAGLKTPKKNLSLYDEEESTYPRGDEGAKLENPAHPAVVEDVIEIKKLPKEFHSTAAGLKKPKKNLSLYDEEEDAYPRGDEATHHENPAHPPFVEDVVEIKKLPADVTAVPVAVPVVVETKELLSAETPTGGDRRGSQSGMKEKVKGAFSGFHMPKLGRRKDETEADVEATASTTHVKPAVVAIAAAAPVAASIAAALRDTSDDEPFIEPPHHRLTSAPAVIAEPLYHKPAAPLIDEEKLTSISARKLEPLSVLPPADSVMVTDKATTTDPGRHSHEVTSHPHVAPDTITAAAVVPAEMKETAEVGTATSQASPTATHPAQRTNSLKIKASLLAAAVAAPLIAAKDKITGHHHDDTATHTTTPSTATTAVTPVSGIHPSGTTVDMPKEQTVVEKKILGKAPDDVASKIPHYDDEEVVMVETITTKTITTSPPTRTHVYEPGGTTIAAAGDPIAHVENPVDVVNPEAKTAEDLEMLPTTTTATEVTPAVDAKGKGRHGDYSPIVAVVPVVASVPAVVNEETPEAVVEGTETETKEAKKERKKKEKQAKKAEAKLNKVPFKTKFKKLTAPGIAAAATAAVNYNDRMPTHPMPVLHVQEHDVNKPVPPPVALPRMTVTENDVHKPFPPAVPAPLLTLTEDDVEKPEVPEIAAPIFTVTEDDVEKPYPILTKHPVMTVPESDVEYPSALDAPYPVIPYVAPKLVSTSALKVASAPRPVIPVQPVQGKDIKFPKVVIPKMKAPKMKVPKIKAPKMPRLKKKNAKVAMTAAAVVPVAKVPEPVVETVTTRFVEPVVVRKPKPVVAETVVAQVVEAPKAVEPPKPIVVAAPRVIEAPKPVVAAEAPKAVEVLEPVAVAAVATKVLKEAPKPVVVPVPVPKPVVVPVPIPKPAPVKAPPQPIAMQTPAPAPAPVVVPTISTNVETVIPEGYSGAIPRVAEDESLIWIKKVFTKNIFYDSEDEDELDELGHRKDRDVSRYVAPSKSTPHSGYGTTAVGGVDNKQVDYTLANHTNAGIVNASQPHQRTIGGYNTQPRQSAL